MTTQQIVIDWHGDVKALDNPQRLDATCFDHTRDNDGLVNAIPRIGTAAFIQLIYDLKGDGVETLSIEPHSMGTYPAEDVPGLVKTILHLAQLGVTDEADSVLGWFDVVIRGITARQTDGTTVTLRTSGELEFDGDNANEVVEVYRWYHTRMAEQQKNQEQAEAPAKRGWWWRRKR